MDEKQHEDELDMEDSGLRGPSVVTNSVPLPPSVLEFALDVAVDEKAHAQDEEEDDNEEDDEEYNRELPNYYDWREVYPFLQELRDNWEMMYEELQKASQVDWVPWPEKHYSKGSEWRVFPFLYTFPADTGETRYVDKCCAACPKTFELLKRMPTIKTALYSRLGPHTELANHRGWADLSNHVLRCHLPFIVPGDEQCGTWVEEEIQFHKVNDFIVFDDSKLHRAFNKTDETRTVLIIDFMRPDDVPRGRAKGGHTKELDSLIDLFN